MKPGWQNSPVTSNQIKCKMSYTNETCQELGSNKGDILAQTQMKEIWNYLLYISTFTGSKNFEYFF